VRIARRAESGFVDAEDERRRYDGDCQLFGSVEMLIQGELRD
jgi:hypothetical protein